MTERITSDFDAGKLWSLIERDKPYSQVYRRLEEYETAEEEGRLVVLPCKVGDEVYIIEKCSNIPERLDGTLYDSDGSPGTATGYYCPYENNCPFGDDDFTIL